MRVKHGAAGLGASSWIEPPAFATDGRNRVVFWNSAAEKLLGVASSAVLGRELDAALAQGILDTIAGACILKIPGRGLCGERTVYLPRGAAPAEVCPLTERERGVVALLADGYAALNIAARLNLSHATIRNHIQNILRKLDVHSQVEAVALVLRRDWVDRLEMPYSPRFSAPVRASQASAVSA